MELKLVNGDYVRREIGVFESTYGIDELMERVKFKLTARKGGLVLMPDMGSELYKITGVKKSQRASMAEMYITDAVSDEPDVSVKNVSVSEKGDTLEVCAEFEYTGGEFAVSIDI